MARSRKTKAVSRRKKSRSKNRSRSKRSRSRSKNYRRKRSRKQSRSKRDAGIGKMNKSKENTKDIEEIGDRIFKLTNLFNKEQRKEHNLPLDPHEFKSRYYSIFTWKT